MEFLTLQELPLSTAVPRLRRTRIKGLRKTSCRQSKGRLLCKDKRPAKKYSNSFPPHILKPYMHAHGLQNFFSAVQAASSRPGSTATACCFAPTLLPAVCLTMKTQEHSSASFSCEVCREEHRTRYTQFKSFLHQMTVAETMLKLVCWSGTDLQSRKGVCVCSCRLFALLRIFVLSASGLLSWRTFRRGSRHLTATSIFHVYPGNERIGARGWRRNADAINENICSCSALMGQA